MGSRGRRSGCCPYSVVICLALTAADVDEDFKTAVAELVGEAEVDISFLIDFC